MWSVTRGLMKRSVRLLIPASIAVIIGTLFISCTFLFTGSLKTSIADSLTADMSSANYVLTSNDYYPSSFSDEFREEVKKMPGVADLRAGTTGVMNIKGASSKGDGSYSIVIPISETGRIMPVDLKEGTWPQKDGQITLEDRIAEKNNIKVGDEIEYSYSVSDEYDVYKAKVVGIAQTGEGLTTGYSVMTENDFCKLNIPSVSSVNSNSSIDADENKTRTLGSRYMSIFLLLEDSSASSKADTVNKIKEKLSESQIISTASEYKEYKLEHEAKEVAVSMGVFFMVFAALSMFVSGMVISNTFKILVTQRRKTLAMLRAVGASKKQLYASVLAESGFLGFVASLIGVGLGMALTGILVACKVDLMGVRIKFAVEANTIIVPVLFGVLTTLIMSVGAARGATSVTPIEALRPVELIESKKSHKIMLAFSILMILIGAVLVFSVLNMTSISDSESLSESDSNKAVIEAMGAVMLIFTGLVMCAFKWLPFIIRGFGKLVSLIGPSSKIAAANIEKNPRRVASTGTALLIGITLVTCVGSAAAAAKTTLNRKLDSMYSIDLQTYYENDFDQEKIDKIKKISGVADVVKVDSALVQWSYGTGDQTEDKTAHVFKLNDDIIKRFIPESLGVDHIEDNQMLFSRRYKKHGAEDYDLKDGKTAKVKFGNVYTEFEGKASQDIKLKEVDFNAGTGADSFLTFAVSENTFKEANLTGSEKQLWIKMKEGTDKVAVYNDVKDIVGNKLSGAVLEQTMYVQIIDSCMNILIGLLAASILIAIVGVANTLGLSVVERMRESATLRAIGMTRRQLKSSLAVEAILISVANSFTGCVLGSFFGWLGARSILSNYGKVAFVPNWGLYGIVFAVAVIAALLASIVPARRAVKTAPMQALAEA